MTSHDGRKFSYAEFGSFVRRFNQEALLAAVARRALKVPLYLSKGRGSKAFVETPPWALAAVAKASIIRGNAYRSTVPQERDVLRACRMHENLVEEELDQPDLNSGFATRLGTI